MKVYLIEHDNSESQYVSGGFTTKEAAVDFVKSCIKDIVDDFDDNWGYEKKYITIEDKLPKFVSFRYNKPDMDEIFLDSINIIEQEIEE